MGETNEVHSDLLNPLTHTGKTFYILVAVLLGIIGWALFAWFTQLRNGLSVTGMMAPVGAPWGLYLVNFVFFIGITHAGLAIASGIRLMKLKAYIGIARMAELVTIFSLMMAGFSVILDLGRPDRIFNVVIHYGSRLGQSPLVWDVTAITTYLILAVVYLYMEMREDLVRLMDKIPRWRGLYRILLPFYTSGERGRVERIIWWASIFNFPIMVMVHSTVAWIFGLMPKPGWYSAIMAPYYVAGAVLSGIAAVVVVAAMYRRVFKWDKYITPQVFRGLGKFLAMVSIIYIYFLLSEHLTVRFAGPTAEFAVSEAIIHGEFSGMFWFQIIGLCLAFIIFFIQTVFPKTFSIGKTVFASALVAVVLWVTRFLIVVPALTRSLMLFPVGTYSPTWVEWSLTLGVFSIVVLLFVLFTKVFPIVPITEMEKAGGSEE